MRKKKEVNAKSGRELSEKEKMGRKVIGKEDGLTSEGCSLVTSRSERRKEKGDDGRRREG